MSAPSTTAPFTFGPPSHRALAALGLHSFPDHRHVLPGTDFCADPSPACIAAVAEAERLLWTEPDSSATDAALIRARDMMELGDPGIWPCQAPGSVSAVLLRAMAWGVEALIDALPPGHPKLWDALCDWMIALETGNPAAPRLERKAWYFLASSGLPLTITPQSGLAAASRVAT